MSETLRKQSRQDEQQLRSDQNLARLIGCLNLKRTLRTPDGLSVLFPLPLYTLSNSPDYDEHIKQTLTEHIGHTGLIVSNATEVDSNTNIIQIGNRTVNGLNTLFPADSMYATAPGIVFKRSLPVDPKKELAFVGLRHQEDTLSMYQAGFLLVQSILGTPYGLMYDYPENLDERGRFTPDKFRQ